MPVSKQSQIINIILRVVALVIEVSYIVNPLKNAHSWILVEGLKILHDISLGYLPLNHVLSYFPILISFLSNQV